MDSDLKLHGGHVGNIMLRHPLGAVLGGLVLGVPSAWIANGAEGGAAGALMAFVGLVLGAPLGAMLAESAHTET